MNVLLIGSGAREHTIAWKLRQSPRLDDLFVAPGNPGTAEAGTNVALDVRDFDAVVRSCREHRIELVVEAMAIHSARSGPLLRIGEDRFTAGQREMVPTLPWSKGARNGFARS